MSKGFTLVELVVVTGIIVLLTALILPNYRSGDKQLALQRSAHRITQTMRMAQEYAISAKEFNGAVPNSYGVYFDLNQPASYILFANLDSDFAYSSSNEMVEEINLESKIRLVGLDPVSGNSLTVVFVPPDPSVFFLPDALSSAITIGILGSEEQLLTQYYYQLQAGWSYTLSPNPACDQSAVSSCLSWLGESECPETIPASKSDPLGVFDRCDFAGFELSIPYSKREREVMALISKIIEVNKSGLIYIK